MGPLSALRRQLRPSRNWNAGAGRPASERPSAVDIVIPVYGAEEDLAQCLASLELHTDLDRHRVLFVIDGPQNEAVEQQVTEFSARHDTSKIFRNEERRGFVHSVNRGMRESTGDVVLLNTDTVVTSNWLEKLIDAAASNGDIATVTPLSNNATLTSVPQPFIENALPLQHTVDSFAAVIERVSKREYPQLPTGVGFCLYLRRVALHDVGLFDEESFPQGYGEENDFCFRALKRGWIHIADDATFILHKGGRSFGTARARLQRDAQGRLGQLHPDYYPTIAAWMKVDPIAAIRSRIREALTPPRSSTLRPPERVVHLVHGFPPLQHAGTELYAAWLVRRQAEWRQVAVYTRLDDRTRAEGEAIERFDEGIRVRLVTNNFTSRNPFVRNALRSPHLERDFARFLEEEKPQLLHIHHLAGHAFSLARVARRMQIPIVYQVQDWWGLCARVNLLDAQLRRCSGPSIAKCSSCATLTKVTPAPLWNRLLHTQRQRAAHAALAVADCFVMGSEAIRRDYEREGLFPSGRSVHVIPYGIELPAEETIRPATKSPIRFGIIGSVLPHKGIHLAVEALRSSSPAAAELHLWGNLNADPSYVESLRNLAGDAALHLHGSFREESKREVFAQIDVLLIPSIGLESFGLVAREAMISGLPVIATADGALNEMFQPGVCGELFPSGDVAALRSILQRLVEQPSIVDEWRRHLPRPKSAAEHAEEIERVYAQLLAGRR